MTRQLERRLCCSRHNHFLRRGRPTARRQDVHPPIYMSVTGDRQEAPPASLTVHMFGGFAVYRGEQLIPESAWQREKAKKLFKLLVLAPQYRLHKDRVLECLWPEKTAKAAANNLNRTLFILRRVLQPDLASARQSTAVALRDDVLALAPAAVAWVDVEAFEQLIQTGRQQSNNLEAYTAALALYKGELLPEDADRQPEAASFHYGAALAVVEGMAGHLTIATLRNSFLSAAPVRQVYAGAGNRESGPAAQGVLDADLRISL